MYAFEIYTCTHPHSHRHRHNIYIYYATFKYLSFICIYNAHIFHVIFISLMRVHVNWYFFIEKYVEIISVYFTFILTLIVSIGSFRHSSENHLVVLQMLYLDKLFKMATSWRQHVCGNMCWLCCILYMCWLCYIKIHNH